MARAILTDELWQRVEPCLPPSPHRRRVPGPHPIHNRAVLAGILFVLKSGLPWEELPAEMGAGSGMTCLRRLRQWQREGVWKRIRHALSGAFSADEMDWGRADRPARGQRRGIERERADHPQAPRLGGKAATADSGTIHHSSRMPHVARSREGR